MSHPAMRSFAKEILESIYSKILIKDCRVLEIGSYDVNGSIRSLITDIFLPKEYIGVDLIEGPNVDMVSSGHELDFPVESFDITISLECLEHNPYWKETLDNMRRLTKSNGYVIISCATLGRLEHGTTRTNPISSPGTQGKGWDYYMNLSEKNFPDTFLTSFEDYCFWVNKYTYDLYFLGAVGSKFDEHKKYFNFTSMRPKSSFRKKIFVDIPLSVARNFLSEKQFQNFGVSYLRLGRRFKRFIL